MTDPSATVKQPYPKGMTRYQEDIGRPATGGVSLLVCQLIFGTLDASLWTEALPLFGTETFMGARGH